VDTKRRVKKKKASRPIGISSGNFLLHSAGGLCHNKKKRRPRGVPVIFHRRQQNKREGKRDAKQSERAKFEKARKEFHIGTGPPKKPKRRQTPGNHRPRTNGGKKEGAPRNAKKKKKKKKRQKPAIRKKPNMFPET